MNKIIANFSALTTALTAFVQSFDEEWIVELGADFDCINEDCLIHYAIAMSDDSALSFRNDFINRFPACADFNIFTLSFLHEIGHLETEWDMVNDTKQRNAIQKMKNKQKAYKRYYALHNERIATNWAGEYLTDNHDTMKKWEEKILKILQKALDNYSD